jgi:dihydrofolate synthase/folylpolyglutamate synthase
VFEWLERFINLERGQKIKSFRLDRMEILMELAGHPEHYAPSIHIAGSKGKGSVTGMISAMLEAGGLRPARYMSPHVINIRERLCLGNNYFNEKTYRIAGDELRDLVEARLPALRNPLFDPVNNEGEAPTFFELLTTYFFLCARFEACDCLVVETGMGGRLDSTNVLDPLVSVITVIELEHTAFLGTTIPAIAEEKAGIIKSGKPLVLAKQKKDALEVFKNKAREKSSLFLYFPEIAELSNVNVNSHGTNFTLTFKKSAQGAFFSGQLDLSIPIPGKIFAENAGLAIAALITAFPQTSEETVRRGLEKLNIPARFEKIDVDPPFIIDGAHTPESFALCVETFCSLYGEGGILIFACAADKDSAAMAEIALPHFSKIFITTPGTFKISDPALAYKNFTAGCGRNKALLVENTEEAAQKARELARKENLPILGTGSFYLASEIRKLVK